MEDIKNSYDVVVIGGGPAGLLAAYHAAKNNAKEVLIIERDRELGGILQQCIHNGFGLQLFKEELTGPAYAENCVNLIKEFPNIKCLVNTMVIDIDSDKLITACNPEKGVIKIHAGAVVLAMGCRERTRGAIKIAGSRPAGVFTAGAAQRMVNMENALPGKTAVILGSGDIGLIMARRLSLEGVKVPACIELSPYSNGLTRNIVQCLEDYDIPLYLSHTIAKIHGHERVTGVTVTKVDEKFQPIEGSEFFIECDTVLLSVGLIPENELSRKINIPIHQLTSGPIVDQNRQTQIAGVFAAGNVLHVHDLADFASEEASIAGKYAALYTQNKLHSSKNSFKTIASDGIRTIVPQLLNFNEEREPLKLFLRVSHPQSNVKLEILCNEEVVYSKPVRHAIPSEMITVNIPSKDLEKITGDITLRLVKR